MPSNSHCCVPGCKDSGDMHKVLHGFPNPQKDKERFIMWLSKIGGDILGLGYEHYKYRRVCHRHFEHKYLCRYNRISKIAVPTLHTPALLLQKRFNTPRLNNNLVNRTPLQQIIDLPLPSTSSEQKIKLKPFGLFDSLEISPAPLPVNIESSSVIASAAATEVTTSHMTCTSPDVLDILEADEYGPYINKDIATRFCHIATTGLNKDARKELVEKYLVPEHCKEIAAPLLNPEIKMFLTKQLVERDKVIEARQRQIASGIVALGKIISTQVADRNKNVDLSKDLMDVARIFCDVQYNESEARRNTVQRQLQDQLTNTKIDKYLFGNNLPMRLKTTTVYKSRFDPDEIIQNP